MDPNAPWFFDDGEQAQGPVSADEVRRMLSQGELTPDTLVSQAPAEAWGTLQDSGLMSVERDAAAPQPDDEDARQAATSPDSHTSLASTPAEPSEIKLLLHAVGPNKLKVIRALIDATDLSLKEAKIATETPGAAVRLDSKEALRRLTADLRELEAVFTVAGEADAAITSDNSPQTETYLILDAVGATQIRVVKELYKHVGCDLREAKALSEQPGQPLLRGASPEAVLGAARALRRAGATVTVHGVSDEATALADLKAEPASPAPQPKVGALELIFFGGFTLTALGVGLIFWLIL